MKLNELSPQQLAQLYRQELTSVFPPEELKPLRSMLSLMEQGRYQALGLYDGEDLVAYALIWLEPGCPFALLDYLGTMAGLRDRGLGSRMLDLLAEHYAHFRGIFGEAEAPENGDPAGEPLRRRRLAFYQRNGFRYGGYDCALFGVHYRALIRGAEDVTAEELLQVHQSIYRRHFPPALYQRFIQIPLRPGERPNPPGRWMEEEKDGVSQ